MHFHLTSRSARNLKFSDGMFPAYSFIREMKNKLVSWGSSHLNVNVDNGETGMQSFDKSPFINHMKFIHARETNIT